MVMVDGEVKSQELETLYEIGRQHYNLSVEEINHYITSACTIILVPETLKEKVQVLYQMAQIAWADHTIDDTEVALLRRYVIRFGFEPDNAEGIAKYLISEVQNNHSFDEVFNAINA